MRRRSAGSFTPPLDLRFIDLFMAIVLALSFVAIMLTVVARMLPTEDVASPPPRQETRQSVAQLERKLDAAVQAQHKAEAELRVAREQIAEQTAFTLPWWLIGFCAVLGVFAVFMGWRIRLWNDGTLPRIRSWLLVTAVVMVVTVVIRWLSDSEGYLLLAAIPWWAADAFCLGLMLVAYVLISVIRASHKALGDLKVRSARGGVGPAAPGEEPERETVSARSPRTRRDGAPSPPA